ncbi:Membrane insertase OXA1/ALB3/YidC [Macleaya cordata]|uniref:Membrane insertase OXA1/ALB3/YidC n=1 Tax=Macleaya cordata TaxID=56857 RepID=A0A200PUT8_MACCD|nr:Membrane insertase OXA1/ALB3/YidC [Macleaya cordata]
MGLKFSNNVISSEDHLLTMWVRHEACSKMGMDPKTMAEGQKKMQELFREYGVTPFTPLKGLFIQGPVFISFYLAITNMVEKVPSFKVGGAFWFTDLTTPDSLYILPVLTALSFLITVECNMQEGLEGNPIASTMKNFSRVLAVLTVPFTMSFPNAIFCYWIPSNLFSLMYGLVIKRPEVKKYLNIPVIPMPPTTGPKPAFSLFSTSKPSEPASNEPSSLPPTPSEVSAQRISSSSVLSQRIRTLEEQVKAKNSTKPSEG